jgi:hypothetical protein
MSAIGIGICCIALVTGACVLYIWTDHTTAAGWLVVAAILTAATAK